MFTIYGCYIQFQFKLITAMYYFHENDPPCKNDAPKPIKMLKMTPIWINKRSDAILHMN